jgi:hypothetical protein
MGRCVKECHVFRTNESFGSFSERTKTTPFMVRFQLPVHLQSVNQTSGSVPQLTCQPHRWLLDLLRLSGTDGRIIGRDADGYVTVRLLAASWSRAGAATDESEVVDPFPSLPLLRVVLGGHGYIIPLCSPNSALQGVMVCRLPLRLFSSSVPMHLHIHLDTNVWNERRAMNVLTLPDGSIIQNQHGTQPPELLWTDVGRNALIQALANPAATLHPLTETFVLTNIIMDRENPHRSYLPWMLTLVGSAAETIAHLAFRRSVGFDGIRDVAITPEPQTIYNPDAAINYDHYAYGMPVLQWVFGSDAPALSASAIDWSSSVRNADLIATGATRPLSLTSWDIGFVADRYYLMPSTRQTIMEHEGANQTLDEEPQAISNTALALALRTPWRARGIAPIMEFPGYGTLPVSHRTIDNPVAALGPAVPTLQPISVLWSGWIRGGDLIVNSVWDIAIDDALADMDV